MIARIAALACLALALPAARAQLPPPATVGQVYDGEPNDIAAGTAWVWLAEGRTVYILDALTGARLGTDGYSPYASTVQAIELDVAHGVRVVAERRALHVHTPTIWRTSWTPPPGEDFPDFVDVKTWPGSRAVFAIAGRKLVVFDFSSGTLTRVAQVDCPIADVTTFRRIHVRDVDGKLRAFLTAALESPVLPRKSALLFADLDREHGYAQPVIRASDWRAHAAYGDPYANSRGVEVVPDLNGEQDVAFVADNTGQVTLLDVSDPLQFAFIARLTPDAGCGATGAVYNIARDPTRNRLFIAGGNMLYVYQLPSLTPLGCLPVEFVDAGKRDMALVRRRDGTRRLWTATAHGVEWGLHSIDVAAPQPVIAARQWWIASCDGAVAVPAWNSVYLPTFGGLTRFDVSNITHPVLVQGSYQAAGGLTEHVELCFPEPSNPTSALLLTATGAGGVQVWPVSQNQPDPGPPMLFRQRPAAWSASDNVYANDAEPYRRNGRNYALCDISNQSTGELALQAYDLANGACVDASLSSSFLAPITSDVCVAGDFAVVATNGGLFTVRLGGLPGALSIAGTLRVDLDGDGAGETIGGVAAESSGTVVYAATDSVAGVASFALDPQTGALSGPLSVVTGPEFTGCVGRIRLYEPTRRLYVPSRNASLFELYTSTSGALQLLSTWHEPGVSGELQDAHVYDFGTGPRVLVVKNFEGFAILDPNDGL